MQPIRTRDALVRALAVAAEIEHGLCLQYLFAAFSLKQAVSEGLCPEELTFVRKWKGSLLLIAAQEMQHLCQVANLSTAVGGTLHLRRPNFPQRRTYYPTSLPWGLYPFSAATLRLHACYERPDEESLLPEDAQLLQGCRYDCDAEAALTREDPTVLASKQPFDHLPLAYRDQAHQDLRPRATAAATVSSLYSAIREAYETLVPPSGDLLIGNPDYQLDGAAVDFPQVLAITNRGSAARAIRRIVHQGEGAPFRRRDSHFGIFTSILREHQALLAKNPTFQPARNVHPNPRARLHVDATHPGWRLIDDAFTRKVDDLCSEVYQTMIMMLQRLYATPVQLFERRRALARHAIRLMTTLLAPLGEALTQLPMGDDGSPGASTRPDRAGPSFELDASVELTPDAEAAWIQLWERLMEHAAWSTALSHEAASEPPHRVAVSYLRNAAGVLDDLATSLGKHAPAT